MRTVNGTHCVSGPREAPEDNSIAARSLITQMETVKVQSAELRHFGVEREWGDTHIMALKVGCGCRVGRQDRAVTVHCQEFGRPHPLPYRV
jgi:hypothetical protein